MVVLGPARAASSETVSLCNEDNSCSRFLFCREFTNTPGRAPFTKRLTYPSSLNSRAYTTSTNPTDRSTRGTPFSALLSNLRLECISAMLSRHPVILALVSSAHAHLQLAYPAPFNASNNPHRTTPADPFLQYPYDCCRLGARWQYPCRGYHSLLGTPDGQPSAIWEPGSLQNWSMTGIRNHYGGSCQVGFSVDGGEAFQVSTSYEGNCSHRDAGNGPEG